MSCRNDLSASPEAEQCGAVFRDRDWEWYIRLHGVSNDNPLAPIIRRLGVTLYRTSGEHSILFDHDLESGKDAYKKIRTGATLVQLYIGFAYGGPALIPQSRSKSQGPTLVQL
ncbi:hypothetical protein Bca101_050124 [Brassica carinata]